MDDEKILRIAKCLVDQFGGEGHLLAGRVSWALGEVGDEVGRLAWGKVCAEAEMMMELRSGAPSSGKP